MSSINSSQYQNVQNYQLFQQILDEEKKKEENAKTKTTVAKTGKRKVSKTWEAMQRLKGSLIVNDPKFLL